VRKFTIRTKRPPLGNFCCVGQTGRTTVRLVQYNSGSATRKPLSNGCPRFPLRGRESVMKPLTWEDRVRVPCSFAWTAATSMTKSLTSGSRKSTLKTRAASSKRGSHYATMVNDFSCSCTFLLFSHFHRRLFGYSANDYSCNQKLNNHLRRAWEFGFEVHHSGAVSEKNAANDFDSSLRAHNR